MVLHPIPSEFPDITRRIFFFYQCTVGRRPLYLPVLSVPRLKGLSHEIDFKNFDQTLKNLT
jgi:hypothetical protein